MASFADTLLKNIKGFVKGIGTSVSNAYSAPLSLGGTIFTNKKIKDTEKKTQELIANAQKLREANRTGNKLLATQLANEGRKLSDESEKTKNTLLKADSFTSNLRERNNIGQKLYDENSKGNYANTIFQALKEGGKSAAYTYGLAKGGLPNAKIAGIMGGISLFGDKEKTFGERFGESMGNMPYYTGFAKATNPIISKTLSKVNITPETAGVIPKLVSSGANVIQGIGMDKVGDQRTTALSMGIDALAGLSGVGQFDVPNAKGMTDQVFTSDKTFVNELMQKIKTGIGIEDFGNAEKSVEGFKKVYGLESYPNWKKLSLDKKVEVLNDRMNEVASTFNNVKMGFVGDTKKTPTKIDPSLDRFKTGETGYQLKGQKVDTPYLEKLKAKGWSENEIDYAIKVTNGAKEVKNAKGFVVGVLRKMNPSVEVKTGFSPSLTPSKADLAKMDQVVAEYDALNIKPFQTATDLTSPKALETPIVETPPIITAQPKNLIEKISTSLNNLKTNLIDPRKVVAMTDTDRGNAIKQHTAEFDQMGLEIKNELQLRGISESDFADMVRGKIETKPEVQDIVDSWRNIFKYEDASARANKDFGKQDDYFPMEGADADINRQLTEFLPNTFVSKMNKMLGHYMPSTGKLAKSGSFETDPLKVLHNYGEQEAISRYDKKGEFESSIEKLVQNIKSGAQNLYDKKGKITTDYLEMLNPSKDRIKSKVELNNFLGEDWVSNENRNFSKLSDDVYKAYIQVRDAKANTETLKDEFSAIIDTGNKKQILSWLATKLNITDPTALSSFQKNSTYVLDKYGAEKLFNNVANKLIYEQPTQNLIDTLSKYQFEGTTKKYLNEWIEKQFAERFVTKSTAAQIADGTGRMFRLAQLGMNMKTAALQPLEMFRSLAKMPLETLNSLKKSITDRGFLKEIDAKYKVSGTNPYFMTDDAVKIGDVSIPKKVLTKAEQAGFFALQKAEDYKNKIFAATAEQDGMAKGLQGQELVDYVRNYVYKYGLRMDDSTIPLMFGGKSDGASFRKLLFQYGQYAISKLVHRVDAVKEKDWKYLAGMVGGDVATFAVLNQLFGVNLGNYLKGEGMISFGPIVSLTEDFMSAGKDYVTDLQSDDPDEANANLTKELGRLGMANFMPYGAQINKTSKMANILNKGYYESAGGRVGYLPPENPVKQGWGLVAGVQSTKEQQNYAKSGYKVLPETVSNQIKQVMETDKDFGREMYNNARANEEAKKIEKIQIKKTMADILKGNVDITPDQKEVVSSRQELVSNLFNQGITDTKEITKKLNEGIKTSGLTSADFTPNEVESYVNLSKTSQPATIFDTVTQNKAEKDRQTALNRIMTSEDYGELTEDQRIQVAQKMGYTEPELKTWQVSKLTKMTTKETADYIISNKETDFVSLYNADALTPSVAQELERRGFIDDADALMENMKKTDPYYQRKALRKAKEDLDKGKLKVAADTQIKLNNMMYKSMKDILGKKTSVNTKLKMTSMTRTLRKRSTAIPKATQYTVKKYTPKF